MERKAKIRTKFFRYFTICILVPVFLFTVLGSVYLMMNDVKTQQHYMEERMKNTTENLDSLVSQVSQIAYTVSENDFLQTCLSTPYTTSEEYYSLNMEADNALLYVSKYFNQNLHVYVIGENQGQYKSGYLSFKNDDFTNSFWYQSLKTEDKEKWFDVHQDSFVANSVNESYLSFGLPVHDSQSKAFLGVVLVELQINQSMKNILEQETEKVYLFHPDTELNIEQGTVELYQDSVSIAIEDKVTVFKETDQKPAYIEKTQDSIPYWQDDFPSQGSTQTNGYFLTYTTLPINNCIWVSVVDNHILYKNIYQILGYSIGFLVLMLLVIIHVSSKLSKTVSMPIELLRENMEKVQAGNFEVQIQTMSNDEIGELSGQFNQMVVDIRSLLNRIREEQEKLRNYELMLLQAQINPHFLYNTLDSLQWLIRMQQQEDALKMTTALTRFFVTGLNRGQDIISLEKEVENVESYLVIQQLRYQSKLNYHISCEEKIAHFQIPKLILQPFVENAIYHGIKGKEHGGIIEVRCYEDAGKIHLAVVDDGLGMAPEQLSALRIDTERMETSESDSYGIKNVRERLQIFYGDICSMEIESAPGVGTMIHIMIQEDGYV